MCDSAWVADLPGPPAFFYALSEKDRASPGLVETPHPALSRRERERGYDTAVSEQHDIIVVGGGHGGAEAAWAGANLGARVALVTLDPAKIGVMSCNPAIGGLAKGQIVREIDALGGLMGLAADATGLNFKVLNQSKGPAVRGPRCQSDRILYAQMVQRMIASREGIEVITGAVERVLIEDGAAVGVVLADGRGLRARAVVLTTGTFMRGLMHTGEERTPGGRAGEAPATGISRELERLGFELGRLRTGTPPRLKKSTIEWDALEAQWGDEPAVPFSDLTAADETEWVERFPAIEQIDCRITRTSEEAHELIRRNLDRAPMYNGQIESPGPRYCPSIEDKAVRFADRQSHHVFLEPESVGSEWVYCNGIATSTPRDVQDVVVRTMPGCEKAEILRYGYAVEYDMVRPHQIDATCMTKRVAGFFLAGQINGTSGYEEAGAQGLLAGLNAVRFARGEEPVRLARDEAYIGVLMDDLATKTPVEPYRMFTSRAEHRLMLRSDNSADRLTAKGWEWGLIGEARWRVFERRREELERLGRAIDGARVEGEALGRAIKRPGFGVEELARAVGGAWSRGVLGTALAERQYEGYIARQKAEIKRHAQMEHRRVPGWIDYERVAGLRSEAKHALTRFAPATFGQASRLEGVTPADVTVLLVAAKKGK